MKLREICETLGLSRRVIQRYEKEGLVASTGKNKYGHLLYDEVTVQRIAQIRFYQELGFSLKEIKSFIDASDEELKVTLERQIQKLRCRIEEIYDLIEKANQFIAGL